MQGVIMYEDGNVIGFDERDTREACKEDLRNEVKNNALGRQYEIVVRHQSRTIFYYNSTTGTKKEYN